MEILHYRRRTSDHQAGWVELIRKKEFAATALDLEHEAFVVYVATLNIDLSDEVYPLRRA